MQRVPFSMCVRPSWLWTTSSTNTVKSVWTIREAALLSVVYNDKKSQWSELRGRSHTQLSAWSPEFVSSLKANVTLNKYFFVLQVNQRAVQCWPHGALRQEVFACPTETLNGTLCIKSRTQGTWQSGSIQGPGMRTGWSVSLNVPVHPLKCF